MQMRQKRKTNHLHNVEDHYAAKYPQTQWSAPIFFGTLKNVACVPNAFLARQLKDVRSDASMCCTLHRKRADEQKFFYVSHKF